MSATQRPTNPARDEARPRRKRGRPRGPTARGASAREKLYATATALIAQEGYEAATLREIGTRAGVSPTLVYRYFPSKRSIVLELYDRLSAQYLVHVLDLPAGRWRERFLHALELSLTVQGPSRDVLRALLPVLVSASSDGLFSERMAFSRLRVQRAFALSVAGARDAPPAEVVPALGRLLYLCHLGVVLWWLLDRSPSQRGTRGLVTLIRGILPTLALSLRVRRIRNWLLSGDALLRDALLGE